VDAGRDRRCPEVPAQREVTDLARGTERSHTTGSARQPRVEHDALADLEALGLGSERHHVGDDLMAEDLRERREVDHRVVGVHLAPVHEHLFRVGAADAGEPGRGHHPVGQQEAGIGCVDEPHRCVRESICQRIGYLARRSLG